MVLANSYLPQLRLFAVKHIHLSGLGLGTFSSKNLTLATRVGDDFMCSCTPFRGIRQTFMATLMLVCAGDLELFLYGIPNPWLSAQKHEESCIKIQSKI